MIYHNPPSAVLRDAEVITFFDLRAPGWKEIVVSRPAGKKPALGALATINIPVDSTDAKLLQDWRDRIAQARASE